MTTIEIRPKTEAQGSDELLRLMSYVDQQEHGTLLTYLEAVFETKVEMNRSGRAKFRRAILRTGREYTVVPSVGYQLADAQNALPIIVSKMARIDSSVRRADKAVKRIQHHFLAVLPDTEREAILYAGSLFEAIRHSVDSGRKLYGREKHQLTTTAIVVPNV